MLAGGSVKVRLHDDLSYDTIHSSEENFWSVLYLTGYLTSIGASELESKDELAPGEAHLRIPNEEIKTIFAETIVEWFRDNMKATNRQPLMAALWNGEEEKASSMLTDLLFQTISYHNYKEDYYHAFLAGIFVGLGYATESDKEHGKGRPDMVIKDIQNQRALIVEVKHSTNKKVMEQDCKAAMEQIAVQKYAHDYLDGYKTVICYRAAFFKKQCSWVDRFYVSINFCYPIL